MIKKYCVVRNFDLGKFELAVERLLDEGWQPYGDLHIYGSVGAICQAMVFMDTKNKG